MRPMTPKICGAVVFGCVVCVGAACAVDPVERLLPTGPSEFGVSLALSATPDVLVLRPDGGSTATVAAVARDAAGVPRPGVTVRFETLVGHLRVDCGMLSGGTVSTGSDGRAAVIYVAPGAPCLPGGGDTTVTIRATMVGANYANSLPRTVEILLVRSGVILPPNSPPRPSFFVSPSTGREDEPLLFDGSASRDDDGQIVSYLWHFGDGAIGSGQKRQHTYILAGAYQVTLTVTDDRGLNVTSAPTPVTIVAAANPVAAFTISPTDPRVGTSIVFNAGPSTVPTGRTLVGFDWDFGDGNQKSGITATHTYNRVGTFTVVLTVTDNTGRKSVASRTVTVLPGATHP